MEMEPMHPGLLLGATAMVGRAGLTDLEVAAPAGN